MAGQVQRYVFDTSSLRALGYQKIRDLAQGHSGALAVPAVCIQELLLQLSDSNRTGAARAVLAALHHSWPKFIVTPEFEDRLRKCFGRRPRLWPSARRYYRELIRSAAEDEAPETVLEFWRRQSRLKRVYRHPDGLLSAKQTGDFTAVIGWVVAEERRQADETRDRLFAAEGVELDRRAKRDLDRSSIAEIERSGLWRAWLYLQMARAAGDRSAEQRMAHLQQHWTPTTRTECLELAKTGYVGGLELGVRCMARAIIEFMGRQRHPDSNDYFDLWALCAVGDSPTEAFVTEERRWHEYAAAVGMPERVVRAGSLLC